MGRLARRAGLRTRVTLAYVLAVAVALLVTGVVVTRALDARFTDAMDDGLETSAAAVARLLVERGGPSPGLTTGLDDPGESFTQVIGPGERLESSTPGLPLRPLLGPGERRRAADGTTIRLRGVTVAADDEPFEELDLEALEETGTEPFETSRARVLARRVRAGGREYAVIAGVTFENHDEALAELRGVLALGLPVALVLVALAGSAAIVAALRPVERMRARAAALGAPPGGERLPVPPGRDELARLGRTLNDLLGRLDRAVERERALVADVSHELRTPLAVISGELELARSGGTREEAEASMRVAADEAARLTRIAEDLLLLARADDGRLELRRERLEVRDLLEAERRRFATRSAAVEVDAPDGLAVDADRVRLAQAVGNLVDNALAHGREPVLLAARRDRDQVVITVRDQGGGFPPDFLPRAFERFARAAEGRSGPGTGLGLPIAALVAEAHGGAAEASNAPDGGAEVRLRLPAA